MRSRASIVFCVALSVGAAGLAHAQVRDRRDTPAPAAPAGTASLSGSVVADEDGHPLGMANVVLIGQLTGALKVTTTDRGGRFAFTKLSADRYTVGASRLPYVGAVAGARRAGRPGAPIVVADGKAVTDVAIRLFKGAVVAGTIYDDRGLASPNTTVTLMQWKMDGDERVLVVPANSSPGATDEAGRYRIFGVPAGEYVVSVVRSQGVAQGRALNEAEVDLALSGRPIDTFVDPTRRILPVYFPGTSRPAEATPLVLTAGEERTGVDVRVEPVRTGRVEGSVVTDSGEPLPPGVQVTLATNVGAYRSVSVATTDATGRFTFPQVAPGPAVVSVTLPRTAGPSAGFTALVPIDTSAGDVIGLQLVPRAPITLPGQISFEGATNPASAGRRVPIKGLGRRNEFGQGQPLVATPASATGAFAIAGVTPGRYLIGGPFIGSTDDSVTWTVKSVMADDLDITDRPYEVKGDAPPKLISITYTDQFQQLSGKLTRSSGAASSDETVIVFSADRAFWYQGSRRIAVTRPASDGVFSFGGPGVTSLPAGDYLLAAVVDLGRDEQFDPSFLATLVPAAAPIKIGPGEKKIQDLVIR